MGCTILITGFDRFPGAPINPTARLVAELARRRRPAGVCLHRHVFATSYAAVDAELPALIARHRPDAIVMFGLATRTKHLRIETRARNRVSIRFPDASGRVASRPAIDPGEPARLGGRAPMHRLRAAVRATGVAATLSCDAGTYVCNYAYWRALAATNVPPLVVFIHVPKVAAIRPRRTGKRKPIRFADLVRAGESILRVLASVAQKVRR